MIETVVQANVRDDAGAPSQKLAFGRAVAAPEIEEALAAATHAMQRHLDDAAFARQIGLVREKQALEMRLANLCDAAEDARASLA